MPLYLVTWWTLGEPERQSRIFNSEDEAARFADEVDAAPSTEDTPEGTIVWRGLPRAGAGK